MQAEQDEPSVNPARRRGGLRLLAVIALVIVGIIGVRAWLGGSEAPAPANRPTQAVTVETVTVERRQMVDAVRGVGSLRAQQSVDISPEIAGRIVSFNFQEGGRVQRGQVLVQMRDARLREQLNSREAALSAARSRAGNAERIHERAQTLRINRQISEGEYEQARTDMQGAQAEVEGLEADIAALREQLADMVIRAPFDGEISSLQVDIGAFVEVGRRIATLYSTDELQMDFSIPERHAGRVSLDKEVEITVASHPGRSFAAQLDFISPSIDERSRTLALRAVVPNSEGQLRPGSFGTARLILERRDDSPVLPEEALIGTRDGFIVFVVKDERAHRRQVTTGLRENGIVAITEGLAPGEIVVRRGHSRISDGTRVVATGGGNAIAAGAR